MCLSYRESITEMRPALFWRVLWNVTKSASHMTSRRPLKITSEAKNAALGIEFLYKTEARWAGNKKLKKKKVLAFASTQWKM